MDELPPNHHGDNNGKFGGPLGNEMRTRKVIGRRGLGLE